MINISSLIKTFIKQDDSNQLIKAVDNVSLDIEKGELFGLIGPDGAGKTTIFRILSTLILPDNGSATISNLDVTKNYKDIRKIIGYMPQRFSLYQDLTIQENIEFFATIYGVNIEQNYDLIKDIYIQLAPFKDRMAGKLSGGMKQKLALCCALIHKPEILILDEPTTGVDVVSRREFWEILNKLKTKITILVSTPYMDEATMCDRIALIQSGKILTINTPAEVVDNFRGILYAIKSHKMSNLLSDIRGFDNTISCFAFGDYHHVLLKDDNINDLVNYLSPKYDFLDYKQIKPTIEDCFMQLMLSE